MRSVRDILEITVLNCKVVSRWIDLHVDIVGMEYTDGKETGISIDELTSHPENYGYLSEHDLADINEANVVVSFTSGTGAGKGGRHVEFGYGLAKNKRMVIVGPRENVFHAHKLVEQYNSLAEFIIHEKEA